MAWTFSQLFRLWPPVYWVLVLCLLLAASAQQLINGASASQPPLSKIFPPKPADQTPPGTGKFVVFAREQTGNPGEWDAIASAWECIPSRPGVPMTRRIEFCHSPWEPGPLLGAVVNDRRSRGRFPRLVTLQVPEGDRRYSMNLYDINYRTWDTRCLWQGGRLAAFGVLNGTVLCSADDEWRALDLHTGAMRKETPFTPLEADGPYWMVRKHGENSGYWTYDPLTEKFSGHFADVKTPPIGTTQSVVSADGKSRAWLLAPMPDQWKGGIISGTIVLQRDGAGGDVRQPVTFQAWAGSGVPIIPRQTNFRFTTDGAVEFAAVQEPGGTNCRVWRIDVASGKSTETVRAQVEPTDDDFAVFDGVPVPEYLRPYLKNLAHFGRAGLAPAFLMHLGLLKERPEYPDCCAGVSPDGRHILYKAKQGPLADVFIYGDLQTRQTVRWQCPPALHSVTSMEFVWVETP